MSMTLEITEAPATLAPPAPNVQPGDTLSPIFRIDTLDTLTPEQCTRVYDDVFKMRDAWTQRDPKLPFYSLGVAGYMDASQGRFDEYRRQARASNPAMQQTFGWLYERTARVMSELLGHPCIYSQDFALPGFHVFMHDPNMEQADSASVHYDLQAGNFDWSDHPGADLDRQLSFTLSVRLPAAGGGLLVWNLNERLLRDMSPEEKKAAMIANRIPEVHPYAEGKMVVHTGQFLHQIAKNKDSADGDQRITFQGHAVYTDAGWVLYW